MCLCVLFIVCHHWHRNDDGIECDEESGDRVRRLEQM